MQATQMNRIGFSVLTLAFVIGMSGATFASDHGGGHGGGGHGGGHGEAEAEEELDVPEGVKALGINLGEYRIHSHYPVDARKSTVRFVLYGSVPTERYAEIRELVKAHEHQLRDQVITATRMTPLNAFDEPGLESFRRRLYLRLRRALPEVAIDNVFVSEFQLTIKSL